MVAAQREQALRFTHSCLSLCLVYGCTPISKKMCSGLSVVFQTQIYCFFPYDRTTCLLGRRGKSSAEYGGGPRVFCNHSHEDAPRVLLAVKGEGSGGTGDGGVAGGASARGRQRGPALPSLLAHVSKVTILVYVFLLLWVGCVFVCLLLSPESEKCFACFPPPYLWQLVFAFS